MRWLILLTVDRLICSALAGRADIATHRSTSHAAAEGEKRLNSTDAFVPPSGRLKPGSVFRIPRMTPSLGPPLTLHSASKQGSSFTGSSTFASLPAGRKRRSDVIASLPAEPASKPESRSDVSSRLTLQPELGFLSAPVLVITALATTDGLKAFLLNFPKVVLYLWRSRTFPSDDSLVALREVLDLSDQFRNNALRLFVKYDSNGDGKLSESELRTCLATEPLLQKAFPEEVASGLVSKITASGDVGPQEFLSLVRGKPQTVDEVDELFKEARDFQIESSYEACRAITSDYAKTFYMATLSMAPQQAKATWAIYTWCRRVDELVDGPNVSPDPDELRASLIEWDSRLAKLYRGDADNSGLDIADIAFRDMIQKYPGSDIQPYQDMVQGMMMDIDQYTYETWDDLYTYCYRVASTVGLMTLPVMGTAPGVTLEQARDPAVALGIALQLTNILRDVGEDARDRGRIYLPQAELREFGVSPESILERATKGGKPDPNYIKMMKFQIERARDWYDRAEVGIALLSPEARLPVAVAGELYKGILDKIEANGYDNFNQRAYLSAPEKIVAVPPLWLKTVTGGWGEVSKE